MTLKRVRVRIFGIVQGVGFRWFVEENAKMLNLKGFVKNRHDKEKGDFVEAVFEGDEKNIDEIIKLCMKGPKHAHVKDVKVNEEEFKGEFDKFKIRYFF